MLLRAKFVPGLMVLATPMFTSCSQPVGQSTSSTQAIIGHNNLAPATDASVRSEVGILAYGDSACTAFATGPQTITTAAHCLLGATSKDLTLAKFTSADGKINASITNVAVLDVTKDYLQLTTDATFQVYLSLGSLEAGPIQLFGYDVSQKDLYSDQNCTASQGTSGSGTIFHTCSSLPGMSGGPLLQNGAVVGIHLGYDQTVDRNVAYDVSLLKDNTTDVESIGIKDECGWGCGGDWRINPSIPNPMVGAGVGGVIGSVIGIPVVGAAVGALIGDHNLAEQKIAELRAANQAQAAQLLQDKIDLDNQKGDTKSATATAAANLKCAQGNDGAYQFVLGQLSSEENAFDKCLENAADNASCQACMDTYTKDSTTELGLGKAIFNCK